MSPQIPHPSDDPDSISRSVNFSKTTILPWVLRVAGARSVVDWAILPSTHEDRAGGTIDNGVVVEWSLSSGTKRQWET